VSLPNKMLTFLCHTWQCKSVQPVRRFGANPTFKTREYTLMAAYKSETVDETPFEDQCCNFFS
jgi:hypothetical protein